MAHDRGGNSLDQAKKLRLVGSKPLTFRDSVSQADPNDLYQLNVSDRSSLQVQVGGLGRGEKLSVELFTLKGSARKVLKAIGRRDFSDLNANDRRKNFQFAARSAFSSGKRSWNPTLTPGNYYLRIALNKGKPAYTISLALAAPISHTPDIPVDTPPTGPTPPSAVAVQFNQTWLKQLGTDKNDYAYGVAVAGDNLYVSGSTQGDLGAPNAGDRDSFVALYNKTDGSFQKVRQPGVAGIDIATGVAANSTGDYYIGGSVVSPATLGGYPDPNGFVARYDRSGNRIWQSDVQGFLSAEAIAAIAADASGNVYAAGFSGGIPGLSAAKLYVAKYDGATGKTVWSASDSALPQSSSATSITLDASGNVYVAGITNATLNADSSRPFTGGDVFLTKFAADGKKLWDKTIASTGAEYARGITVDPTGNVYITGQTDGTLPGQTSAGGIDSFVAKYDTNGNQQWLKQFGTAALDEGQGIVYSNGTVYLTGETAGSLYAPNKGGSDAWIAAFDGYGRLVGSTQIGTDKDDETYNITADAAGHLYAVGQTYGAFAGATNQGQYDVWVAQYSVAPVT